VGKQRDRVPLPPTRGETAQERETGLLKASVRDFHALRTTWITLALMQGMPLELVQTVTGHATAEIVMQHYFKPQREQLREAMQKTLPGMLSSSSKPVSAADRAEEILRTAHPDKLQAAIDEALKVLTEKKN
jgi:hypothetical protein